MKTRRMGRTALILALAVLMALPTSVLLPGRALADPVIHTVSTPEQLQSVIDAVYGGDTIKLLNDITYSSSIVIDGKGITLNLDGHTLTVTVADAPALKVINGGDLSMVGEGQLIASYQGIYVTGEGSSATVNGDIIVVSIGGGGDDYHPACALAEDGGSIEIVGTLTATGDSCSGAYASGNGSIISVTGDVEVSGWAACGLDAENNGQVNVDGDVTAVGEDSVGVGAWANAAATVEGKVTASGASSVGVVATGSDVTIDGPVEVFGAWSRAVNSVGEDSSIIVNGDVTASGNASIGIHARDHSTCTVHGDVEVTGSPDPSDSPSYGAWAEIGGTVTVDGDVTVSGAGSHGVWASSASLATIRGTISGDGYIKLFDVPKQPTDGEFVTEGADDFWIFTDGTNTVKVGIAITRLSATPSGLPAGGGNSTITVSGMNLPGGLVNGTNLPGQITVAAFEGVTETDISGTTTGTPESQTVSLSFPGNSGTGAKTYTIKASLDNGTTWKATATSVAVSASSGGGEDEDDGVSYYVPPSVPKAVVSGTGVPGTTLPINLDSNAGRATVDASAFAGNVLSSGGTAVVTLPSVPGVNSFTLTMPATALSNPDGEGALTLSTEVGSITVPSGMLAGIPGVEGKTAGITIAPGDTSGLPEEVKATIGDRPIVQLTLTLNGTQTEWSNPDFPVTVSIPYTPTAEELANPEGIVVWYIDGSGNVVSVPNGRYDPETGTVTFTTTHFSHYAVAYRRVVFADVAPDAWYAEAVSFISARDITRGTGEDTFSPEMNLTKSQAIVMLMRAYGIAPDAEDVEMEDNFSDAGDTWYTGYLSAAKRLGISSGVGDNLFAPETEITRQELFTMLYNTLAAIGDRHILPSLRDVTGNPLGPSSGRSLSDFTDAGDTAPWAMEAMELLVETGVVQGSEGRLWPLATTTRAEMAQVLYNLFSR